jgi:hypothetical protein
MRGQKITLGEMRSSGVRGLLFIAPTISARMPEGSSLVLSCVIMTNPESF